MFNAGEGDGAPYTYLVSTAFLMENTGIVGVLFGTKNKGERDNTGEIANWGPEDVRSADDQLVGLPTGLLTSLESPSCCNLLGLIRPPLVLERIPY